MNYLFTRKKYLEQLYNQVYHIKYEYCNHVLVEEPENITLSVEETVRLPEAVHTHLFGKRMATLTKLQTLYLKVHFDLSRQRSSCPC